MTISYNRLGSNGRLGNQMFQYASLRGIANYNHYQWMIPPPDCNHKDNYGLFDTFEMKHVKPENLGFNDAMTVTEKTHAFDGAGLLPQGHGGHGRVLLLGCPLQHNEACAYCLKNRELHNRSARCRW